MAAAADSQVFFGGHWILADETVALQSIHHLGGGYFTRGTLIWF